MSSVSFNGEDLVLNSSKSYFVIDALYIADINREINNLNKTDLEMELREKVFPFPYTDIPFAKVNVNKDTFKIKNIRKVSYEDIDLLEKSTCLSCDSGMILFIEEKQLYDFVKHFRYDDLVDSITDSINIKYWDQLVNKFPKNEIGAVLAPGFYSGYDFEGSGTYKIKT